MFEGTHLGSLVTIMLVKAFGCKHLAHNFHLLDDALVSLKDVRGVSRNGLHPRRNPFGVSSDHYANEGMS